MIELSFLWINDVYSQHFEILLWYLIWNLIIGMNACLIDVIVVSGSKIPVWPGLSEVRGILLSWPRVYPHTLCSVRS